MDDFFEWLYDFLAWGDFRARLPLLSGHGDGRSKRSLTSLVDEVRALIPFEKVLAWVYEQLVTNDDMLVLMRKLHVRWRPHHFVTTTISTINKLRVVFIVLRHEP